MPQIVTLNPAQVGKLAAELEYARLDATRVRLMVQDGGIKIAVGAQPWSLPLGTVEERP